MEHRAYEKLLKFAIHNEIKAHDFYHDVSKRLEEPFLKQLFSELAEQEKGHQKVLEGFGSVDPGTIHFEEVPDYGISETVDKPEPSTIMKPADAFALAMKNEDEAMHLYTGMANACSDIRQKEMLLELAAMEREHKFRMENAFVDIAYPEVW